MSDNPYSSDRVLGDQKQRPVATGGALFVVLGILLVGLPLFAIVGAGLSPRTPANVNLGLRIGSIPVIALGLLVLLHGCFRSQRTIYAVVALLFFLVVSGFLALILLG